MIFLVFMSTSAMLVMSGTMACRCWLDSDPDRQALMMVLAGTPMVRNSLEIRRMRSKKGQWPEMSQRERSHALAEV